MDMASKLCSFGGFGCVWGAVDISTGKLGGSGYSD